ncbi:putative HTH-type transcriptional regulator [Zhongshania aliphaticivorans]|uniref:Putative HTH-type transcriptional regulator n=1 Tax=Zhongshania aliphaticivorans TaxID=1470434 RepID=A0A5S9N8B4_9GAMM|nr:helix-turn-helix domain-containing protein [Zhongshania aliphaticivorans]CAA0079224.1 putative HTH-type transcriptional regulator [Zhongshania aliphaticivorans]CAA0086242.1 putative HTH-type transcriptional regulator [Zhongshania aliphaticivorans]
MRWDQLDQQPCSLARTLAVIGDRWTLLILRDCFLGVRRFEQFEKRLGITRHLLTARLKKLVENGVLYKSAYQERPLREEYRLSEKGLALHPIILNLVNWGDTYMSDERGAPIIHIHKNCGHIMQPRTHCSECGDPITAKNVRVEIGPGWQDHQEELLAK